MAKKRTFAEKKAAAAIARTTARQAASDDPRIAALSTTISTRERDAIIASGRGVETASGTIELVDQPKPSMEKQVQPVTQPQLTPLERLFTPTGFAAALGRPDLAPPPGVFKEFTQEVKRVQVTPQAPPTARQAFGGDAAGRGERIALFGESLIGRAKEKQFEKIPVIGKRVSQVALFGAGAVTGVGRVGQSIEQRPFATAGFIVGAGAVAAVAPAVAAVGFTALGAGQFAKETFRTGSPFFAAGTLAPDVALGVAGFKGAKLIGVKPQLTFGTVARTPKVTTKTGQKLLIQSERGTELRTFTKGIVETPRDVTLEFRGKPLFTKARKPIIKGFEAETTILDVAASPKIVARTDVFAGTEIARGISKAPRSELLDPPKFVGARIKTATQVSSAEGISKRIIGEIRPSIPKTTPTGEQISIARISGRETITGREIGKPISANALDVFFRDLGVSDRVIPTGTSLEKLPFAVKDFLAPPKVSKAPRPKPVKVTRTIPGTTLRIPGVQPSPTPGQQTILRTRDIPSLTSLRNLGLVTEVKTVGAFAPPKEVGLETRIATAQVTRGQQLTIGQPVIEVFKTRITPVEKTAQKGISRLIQLPKQIQVAKQQVRTRTKVTQELIPITITKQKQELIPVLKLKQIQKTGLRTSTFQIPKFGFTPPVIPPFPKDFRLPGSRAGQQLRRGTSQFIPSLVGLVSGGRAKQPKGLTGLEIRFLRPRKKPAKRKKRGKK